MSSSLGYVAKPGKAGVQAIGPTVGGELQGGDRAGEGGSPGVELLDAGGGQGLRLQVRLHDVHLGQAVGDRRRSGERRHPVAMSGPQPRQLQLEILGPLGTLAADARDVGCELAVLVHLGLVAENEVDAGLLEG
ncbi:MAG: hypothetical protein ACRDHY_06725, partial [Anaerolineales bacterium]